MSGIYIHVPWCRGICPYCGFDVVRDDGNAPWEAYVDRVLQEREFRRNALPEPPATVFFGGGTPSRMPIAALERLIAGLAPAKGAEISAEVNPEDANEAWLEGAKRAGVTRISVGVQTFDDSRARFLGRAHTTRQARNVLRRVSSAGFQSWSADLMFALPDQTLDQLARDLDALLAFEPPHVALYGLTIEADTPFAARRKAGKLDPLPDDAWRTMYDYLVDRLEEAGLDRYEVSNFARSGHRSRHNEGYWRGRPYLGLGPAAHGFGANGDRWVNLADPNAWLSARDPTAHREHPTGEEAAVDRLVSGMRHVSGVDLEQMAMRTRVHPSEATLDRLVAAGLLWRRGPVVGLTHQGFPIADSVVGTLVAGLQTHARTRPDGA